MHPLYKTNAEIYQSFSTRAMTGQECKHFKKFYNNDYGDTVKEVVFQVRGDNTREWETEKVEYYSRELYADLADNSLALTKLTTKIGNEVCTWPNSHSDGKRRRVVIFNINLAYLESEGQGKIARGLQAVVSYNPNLKTNYTRRVNVKRQAPRLSRGQLSYSSSGVVYHVLNIQDAPGRMLMALNVPFTFRVSPKRQIEKWIPNKAPWKTQELLTMPTAKIIADRKNIEF